VSDGSLSFYHDHFVRSRVSKFTYGRFCCPAFDPADQDHQQRVHKTYTSVSGLVRVNDFFDVILPKVCLISFVTSRSLLRGLCRIRKFRRLRNLDGLAALNTSQSMSSKMLLPSFRAIGVPCPRRSGKTSIRVSF
jgi:hypothetical protein